MWTSYRFNKRVLGIALGERSALIAEVAPAPPRCALSRAARFVYPAGSSLEKPELLGQALGDFLRQNQFSSRSAVLGVPARWLIHRLHSLPPADPQNAQAILALQAQSLAPPELGEMVFDYSGQPSELAPSDVTFIGLPASRKDRLLDLASSAGLKLIAMTPATAALAAASPDNAALILFVGSEGAELAAFAGTRLTTLRHLSTAAPALFAAELRRAVGMLSIGLEASSQNPSARGSSVELILWDNTASSNPQAIDIAAIGEAAGIAVTPGDPAALAASIPADSRASCAIALATSALGEHKPEVDFLHPKLAPLSRHFATRRSFWVATTAAIVSLIAIAVYADYAAIQRDISRSDQRLAAMDGSLKTAKPFVTSMLFVEEYQLKPPRSLACLADVYDMVPAGGQTYLSSFHLQGNMKGDLAGRAPTRQDFVDLMDKFAASGRFVDLRRTLEGRGAGAEVTFSVTFTYVPRS